jgi:hypothetical protein
MLDHYLLYCRSGKQRILEGCTYVYMGILLPMWLVILAVLMLEIYVILNSNFESFLWKLNHFYTQSYDYE